VEGEEHKDSKKEEGGRKKPEVAPGAAGGMKSVGLRRGPGMHDGQRAGQDCTYPTGFFAALRMT
jgi:hypothetical protein